MKLRLANDKDPRVGYAEGLPPKKETRPCSGCKWQLVWYLKGMEYMARQMDKKCKKCKKEKNT